MQATIKMLYFGESNKAWLNEMYLILCWYMNDIYTSKGWVIIEHSSNPLNSQFQLLTSRKWFNLILDNLGYNVDEC